MVMDDGFCSRLSVECDKSSRLCDRDKSTCLEIKLWVLGWLKVMCLWVWVIVYCLFVELQLEIAGFSYRKKKI